MITTPVKVGDYICQNNAGRYGSIFKVVGVDIDNVTIKLVSETTPVSHQRKFYKNSKDIREVKHSDIAAHWTLGFQQIYDSYIKHFNKEWSVLLENLI